MKAERLVELSDSPFAHHAMIAMPKKQPHEVVSVVIVTYHTGPVLWRCIESILSQKGLNELIIVDNGNPKKVQHRLGKLAAAHDKVIYLSGHGNIGFAKACNMGVRHANSVYSLLLNPDCLLPHPHILQELVTPFAKDNDAWMASCKLVDPDHREAPTCRRNLLTPLTALVESFSLYHFLPKAKANRWRLNNYPLETYDIPSHVPAISGALMLFKTERYKSFGGIDEGYFLHVEDMDVCMHIYEQGGKILYIPTTEVMHFKSTSDVSSWFIERQKTKGFIRYFKKNFKDAYEPGVLPLLYMVIWLRSGLKASVIALRSLKKRNTPVISKAAHAKKLLKTYKQPHFMDAMRAFQSLLHANAPLMISGSSSQIGLCLIRRILAADIPVYAQYHSQIIDFYSPKLSWLQADFSAPVSFEKMRFEYGTPETLIHTAPLWLLTEQLESLKKLGIKRIIAFSSTSIFGKEHSRNKQEQQIVQQLKEAEETLETFCKAHHIAFSILRPTMIYGAALDQNVSKIARFIQKFGFFPVTKPAEGLRNPVHVDDLALAVISLLSKEQLPNKRYNVMGNETLSYYSMVERIFAALDKKPRILSLRFLPFFMRGLKILSLGRMDYVDMAKRMRNDLVFDQKPAEQDFGYRPHAFLPHGKDDLFPAYLSVKQKKEEKS